MAKTIAQELKKTLECLKQVATYPVSGEISEILAGFNSLYFDINVKSAETPKNQPAIKSILVNGCVIEVNYNSSECEAFTSSDETQALLGNKKWLGLLLDLKLPVTNVKYSNYELTSVDVAEAESVGGNGTTEIVLYVYEGQTKTFYLEATGKEKTTYTVKLNNLEA